MAPAPTRTFEIEAGGKSYEVQAPSQAEAVRGFEQFRAASNGATPSSDQPVTLQIGDRPVEVDSQFLKLSPAEQQRTVNEIVAALPPAFVLDGPPSAWPQAMSNQPLQPI